MFREAEGMAKEFLFMPPPHIFIAMATPLSSVCVPHLVFLGIQISIVIYKAYEKTM